jgi:hypothetical protein
VSFDIRPLCSQREDPGAQQIGGWVDTRASLGSGEKSLLTEVQFRLLHRPTNSIVPTPTELSWLLGKPKQMVETSGKKQQHNFLYYDADSIENSSSKNSLLLRESVYRAVA